MRYTGIDVTVRMPRNLEDKPRKVLERAADACPIKHALKDDIPFTTRFVYPSG